MTREQRIDGWALKDREKFIGLDEASGGYPYIPSNIRSVHLWDKEEDAEAYRNIIARGGTMGGMNHASRWRIVRVVLIEVEPQSTSRGRSHSYPKEGQ